MTAHALIVVWLIQHHVYFGFCPFDERKWKEYIRDLNFDITLIIFLLLSNSNIYKSMHLMRTVE